MDTKDLWKQVGEILKDLLPPEASIALADDRNYVDYRPGQYDIHIQPGARLPLGSVSARVVLNHANISAMVDSSLFGIPYFGRGYPFHMEDAWGAVTVIYPPEEAEQEPVPSILLPASPVHKLSYVTGQADNVWVPVSVRDISYFESYQKKIWLHTRNSAYATGHTLAFLEARLPAFFLRIHRSYIVNVEAIEKISRGIAVPLFVTLNTPDCTHLPVSQSYVRQVRERLGF